MIEQLMWRVLGNSMVLQLKKTELIPIAGDASFRQFFRKSTKKKGRIIVICKKDKYKNLIVYSAINNFLRKNKILAPKLLKHSYKNGIIEIQDFGNTSYYEILSKKKEKLKIYKRLVDLLLKIQIIKIKRTIKTILNKSVYLQQIIFSIQETLFELFRKDNYNS